MGKFFYRARIEFKGLPGRILISAFLLGFVVLGVLITIAAGGQCFAIAREQRWTATPCTILTSRVIDDRTGNSATPYRWALKYRYVVQGTTYESEIRRDATERFGDYAEAARLVRRFPPDAAATCFVNPADPAQAMLERHSLPGTIGVALSMPIIFVGLPLLMLYVAVRRGLWRRPSTAAPAPDAQTRLPLPIGLAISSLFLFGGGAAAVVILVLPVCRSIASQSWTAVSCDIASSHLTKGPRGAYDVDVLYHYQIGGVDYQSNSYDFDPWSLGGEASSQLILQRYPAGTRATCFVNPSDPQQSVMFRGLRARVIAFGAFFLLFPAVGALGLWGTLRERKAGDDQHLVLAALHAMAPARAARSRESPDTTAHDSLAASHRARIDRRTRWMLTVVLLVITSLWNGIAFAALLPEAFAAWRYQPGAGAIGATILFVGFAGIGLFMLGKALRIIRRAWRREPPS